MRILIYGGAGFIGTSVARCLIGAGHNVIVADRTARLTRNASGMEGIAKEPLESGALSFHQIDILIYLASGTLPATSMDSLSRDAEENIMPALRVMEKAAATGVKRIIFASSGGTVYGIARSLPIEEDHPTVPLSGYGVSKLAIENYLAILSRRTDISAVSLRISNPYGPYQFQGAGVGAIAHFMSRLHTGQPIRIWGDGSVIRDYLHIDDVAAAFSAVCTEDGLSSGAYNVGSGLGITLTDLLKKIMIVSGVQGEIINEPPRDFDVPTVILSTQRIERAVGWRAKIDIDSGLQRMWETLHKLS